MLIILSPAKSLDYVTVPTIDRYTSPVFLPLAAELVGQLRSYSPMQLAELMSISPALAQRNVERYADWTPDVSPSITLPARVKQAILAFAGDVYEGLDACTLSEADLVYAQDRVRILSGLYGVLRPLDAMQAYRLEMGIRLPNVRGANLYDFWGTRITDTLNAQLSEMKAVNKLPSTLIDLASIEYSQSIQFKALKASVIKPVFEDWKNGRYKIISFYAKRARGFMARYAIVNRIEDPQELKLFSSEGYAFVPEVSDEKRWVFRRQMSPISHTSSMH